MSKTSPKTVVERWSLWT